MRVKSSELDGFVSETMVNLCSESFHLQKNTDTQKRLKNIVFIDCAVNAKNVAIQHALRLRKKEKKKERPQILGYQDYVYHFSRR